MSSQTEILAQVRLVLDEHHPAEVTIRAIRRLLDAPRQEGPLEYADHGWPVLQASEVPAGESRAGVRRSEQSNPP